MIPWRTRHCHDHLGACVRCRVLVLRDACVENGQLTLTLRISLAWRTALRRVATLLRVRIVPYVSALSASYNTDMSPKKLHLDLIVLWAWQTSTFAEHAFVSAYCEVASSALSSMSRIGHCAHQCTILKRQVTHAFQMRSGLFFSWRKAQYHSQERRVFQHRRSVLKS